MIAVYCFYPGDEELALKNARWIQELGGCKGHELVAAYDPRCNPGVVEQIRQELSKSFDKLHKCPAPDPIDGWPEGANYFFRIITTWLQNKQQWPCFFWMEPDAIPLTPGWLNKLEAEYWRGNKPFMGDRVQVEDIPLHMSGVGIYQNPIYLLAGEAYRAYDVAWDMAAKDQIVPNAHFTNLIEHAWKHPTFHMEHELETQIAPETILFHSSKDGSLINLLQSKKRGGKQSLADASSISSSQLPTGKEPEEPGSPSPPNFPVVPVLAESHEADSLTQKRRQDESGEAQDKHRGWRRRASIRTSTQYETSRGDREPIYDIFIRTYPGDYEWIYWCIRSIDKFVTGFRKIWIVSPQNAPEWMDPRMHSKLHSGTPIEWKVMNDETEDGYLAQQITKLYADVLCDYQADYILHVDSDVVFLKPTTPQDLFRDGKLIWYYTPYDQIQTPWQPITEKFMAFPIPFEYMRRLPMMVPRWLYPRLREFCHNIHGQIISEYIRTQPMRAFSEFNALGAYAHFHHPDSFAWIDTSTLPQMPPPFAKQFHSWSGLTPEVKREIEEYLGGAGVKPKEDAPPVPSQIKKLPNGVWIIANDQIGNWIEQTNNQLDHDPNLLPMILDYINSGDVVVDVGAYIGDHTIAYARKAKTVHAFEPHPLAYECLVHNLKDKDSVLCYNIALGDKRASVPLSGNNGELDGCYIGEHMKVKDVPLHPLDDYKLAPDLIKIDVEGYEYKVLRGATKTIEKHRPKMVIEINREALKRQGSTPDQIYGWLAQKKYRCEIIEDNIVRSDPLYNIVAIPKK